MMSLSRKIDYALLALMHLAVDSRAVVSAREIAESFEGSTPLLMNVLKQLCSFGLVESVRGAKGGYRLALPAEEIELSQLIEAVEGPIRLTPCVGEGAAPADALCSVKGDCPIQVSLIWLHGRFMAFLQGITLADLSEAGGSPIVTAGGGDRNDL